MKPDKKKNFLDFQSRALLTQWVIQNKEALEKLSKVEIETKAIADLGFRVTIRNIEPIAKAIYPGIQINVKTASPPITAMYKLMQARIEELVSRVTALEEAATSLTLT